MKRTCGTISHTYYEKTCDVVLPGDVVSYLIQIVLGEKIKKLKKYRWLMGLSNVTQYFQAGVAHFLSNNLHQLGPNVVFHMRGRNIGRIMGMRAITKLKLPFQDVELDDYLTGLKNLQTLDLCQTYDVLTCLTRLTNLTSLKVENNNAYAVKHLTNLKSLATCSVTTDEDIKGLTSLTLLDIKSQLGCTKITENSLKHLTNLTILSNSSTGIGGGSGGTGIRLSDVLPNLTELRDYGGLSSQDVAGLTKLKTLILGPISVIGGDVISTLSNLEILISCIHVSHHGISQLTNLRILDTLSPNLSNDSISALSRLEYIRIDDNNIITDVGLANLIKLKGLIINGSINISGRCFSYMTQLEYLSLWDTAIVDDGIKHLPPSLRILDSNNNRYLTNNGISCLTQLSSLILRNVAQISNDGIEKLTQLRSLYVGYSLCATLFPKNITSWTNLRHICMPPSSTQYYKLPPNTRISKSYDDFVDKSGSTFPMVYF